MLSIEKRVLQTIDNHRLITDNQSVIVGVSGGPDSVCLLNLLGSLFPRSEIYCVYIDHHLRPEEVINETKVVKNHCSKLSVEFIAVSVDVSAEVAKTGESIEACARRLRYHALEEIRQSKSGDSIAVGHTSDDQVEGVLLRLIRGTGLKGLAGMTPQNNRIIRPLLEISKQEVLSYLKRNELAFCHDTSNESSKFLRNRIRLVLLPLLESRFNPSIRETILKTAEILNIEEDYLHKESDRAYEALISSQNGPNKENENTSITLPIPAFRPIHSAIQKRIIERICWEIGCRPDSKILVKIIDQITNGTTGSELHLPDGVRVVKQSDSLLFTILGQNQRPRDQLLKTIDLQYQAAEPGNYHIVELGYTLTLKIVNGKIELDKTSMIMDADRIQFPLMLRSLKPGDRFKPLGAPGSKKIGRFLSDKKIPKHQRHLYPLLISENKIICILGLAIDDRYRITENTKRSLVVTWKRD